MDRDPQLKRVADAGRLYALPDAAPEGRVQKNHINGSIQRIGRKLLKVDDHRVRSQRHPNFLAHATHSIHAENRIFQIVVAEILDSLAKPDGRFGGPDAVWIEAKAIAVELRG